MLVPPLSAVNNITEAFCSDLMDFGPVHFGPGTEDLHNALAMHYGQVQVLSSRALTYDVLHRHNFNFSELAMYVLVPRPCTLSSLPVLLAAMLLG